MKLETITRKGKRFVLVPESQYARLARRTSVAAVAAGGCGRHQRCNRICAASIARRLITERRAAGLSQEQLARMAGVRQETVSRIEGGKHTATVRVISKLEGALKEAKHKPLRRRTG